MRRLFSLFASVIVSLAALAFVAADAALAQTYPSKTIRIVVGFSPGGATDIVARLVAPALSEELGVPVYVENKAGASATLAAREVAKNAPADGYTLLLSSVTDTAQPSLRKDLGYDYVADLAPISLLGVAPNVLVVNPDLPVENLQDLIDLARSEPGSLNYGSAGIGSSVHISAELFKSMADLDIVHIPYPGASDALTAVVGGSVPMAFAVLSGAQPLIEAGRLKPIAVTSLERFPLAPTIPTLNEQGLTGYEIGSWWGLSARAGTPDEIIDRLNAAVAKVMATAELKEAFNKMRLEPRSNTPEEFAAFIVDRIEEDSKLLSEAGIQPTE